MKCTGRNCPMQNGTVDPAHCLADECPYLTRPMTNADCLNAMTNEEKARFLSMLHRYKEYGQNENADKICEQLWLDWLKQEA